MIWFERKPFQSSFQSALQQLQGRLAAHGAPPATRLRIAAQLHEASRQARLEIEKQKNFKEFKEFNLK